MKQWMEEQEARGFYDVGEKYVCAECFTDPGIKAFVMAHASNTACSYCDRTADSAIAAPIDDVLECIVAGLRSIYGDPNDEGVPWESLEGGWQGKVHDTYDVVMDNIEMAEGNKALFDDLLHALGDRQWCQVNYGSLPPEDILKYGWEEFSRVVKTETRYVFLKARKRRRYPYDHDEIVPPDQMLSRLGAITKDLNLIRLIPRGTRLFRCRIHKVGLTLRHARELGSPPAELAVFPNRMSPAGIPMFYGAFDADTCLTETFDPTCGNGKLATIAAFRPKRRLVMLDLASIPTIPSIYDESRRDIRPAIGFLHGFSADICKPIAKDGTEHIEYVPSQIVTEYYRRIFKPHKYPRLDGIIYSSSKVPDATACVVFCGNEDCADLSDEVQANKALLTLSECDVSIVDPNKWKEEKGAQQKR